MAILDFSPCPGVFSGPGGWFLYQMASFGPLQSSGGVASSNFDFTYLSIHANIDADIDADIAADADANSVSKGAAE